MTDPAQAQAIALFRYGFIADLLHMPVGSRGLYARLREKAAADYAIPGSSRTRIAVETLRHWLKAYRPAASTRYSRRTAATVVAHVPCRRPPPMRF